MLLTSFSQRGDAQTAQAAGFAAYLTKPVRQTHLYDCLRLTLGSPPPRPGAGAPSAAPLITRHTVTEAQARRRGRVLVVEDNVVNQKVAAKILEREGYRVDVAANGREAVEAVAQIPYALVFMDCQMPEMDGYAATRAIRKREASLVKREAQDKIQDTIDARRGTHGVPIIAMTAHALQGASGNLGATRMQQLCGELQTLGLANDLTMADDRLARLGAEFALVRTALLQKRDGLLSVRSRSHS